ncbi:eukaryotic translation initiation factor 2-alpha kinase 1-like [Onthophagus taurus]|uniref:eukaryotic translation initiation factor 2-alpha kinase 1-like n=1 Tax=Onthophagus taurus TaxID=166361 RepID=UPI000C20B9A1|nr:eukaryotic translation initiation factor 2-alpha kinase 1-like [Onthophagus taurus]
MAKSGMSESDVEPEDGATASPPPQEDADDTQNEMPEDSVCVITNSLKPSTPISILIESLVKNLCYLYEPNPDNATRTYRLICEKLYSMRLIDESYDMNEFEGMRNQYQRAVHHLLTTASGGDQTNPLRPLWPNVDITNEWSHYYREFDELEYIAGGGFGKVYKVKHKLDSTEYAVKKIFIRSEGINSVRNYLSEVKTFASLNHSNIVQYKAAWLELGADIGKNVITEHTSESEISFSSSLESMGNEDHRILDENINQVETYLYPTMISEAELSFQRTKEKSSEFEVKFEQSIEFNHHSLSNSQEVNGKKKCREKRNSISEGGKAICTIEEIQNIQQLQTRQHPKWATLYIQMTLCQTTLKQWLENRNIGEAHLDNNGVIVPVGGDLRSKTIIEILKQLLQGLQYIHSKNIVHHDIKPSNIFLQNDNGSLLVQLGDFGLACPLQSARHSLALGTKLYAAPEQLRGSCNRKSDMYSLGIIVLELTESFQTDMERVESINQLREGHLDPQLQEQQPQLSLIIRQLVVNNPNERPDAMTLLQRLTVDVNVESEIVKDLRTQLAEKEKEISRLKALLKDSGHQNQ